jgi:hypothetical protein|tara:strand:- start:456 stop:668 length:213 start_codon:yes stop_codon:yes gene_type:complete
MSAEKILNIKQKPSVLITPEVDSKKHTGRVDINHLLDRVRREKEEENKTKFTILIFFLVFILVSGAILTF